MKLSSPGLLFVGCFLITVSISVLVIGLFLPGITLGNCNFLRILHSFQVVHFIGIELLVVVFYACFLSEV